MGARPWLLIGVVATAFVGGCADDEGDATTVTSDGSITTPTAATVPTTASTSAASSSSTAPPTTAAATTTVATTAASPASLGGREFVSTEVVGFQLVPGTQISLTFDGDRLGAVAGCNQLSSTWSLQAEALVVPDVASTMMACEPPTLMDQDTWLSAFLTSEPTVMLDGDTLVLTVGGSSITLLDREVAYPDRALEGPAWTLETIVSADAVSSVPVGVRPPTLVFAGGQVEVDTGCNTGSGSYEATDGEVTFTSIAVTELGCDEATMQVEAAIVAVLDGTVTYSIDADLLTLTKGDRGLAYRAS